MIAVDITVIKRAAADQIANENATHKGQEHCQHT